jgi:acyl carrier protein
MTQTQEIADDMVMAEVERQVRLLLPGFDGVITPATRFDELDMDSLTRVDLLAAVEIAFGVEVPDEEVANLVGMREVVDLIRVLRGDA